MKRSDALLLAGAAMLAVVPFVATDAAKGGFEGADEKAVRIVSEEHPGYRPWFHPVWEPPDAGTESLLFGVQAAIGAGALFYVVGYRRGVRAGRNGK